MANMIDDSQQINVNVTSPIDYEDFDTYPVFSNTYLARNGSELILTNYPRVCDSYVRKEVNVVDFDVVYKLNASRWDGCTVASGGEFCAGAIFVAPTFRNDEGHTFPPSGGGTEALSVLLRTYNFPGAEYHYRLRLRNSLHGWNTVYGTAPEMTWSNFQLNTDYYIRFWRETLGGTSTVNVGVYIDEACTTLLTDISPNPTSLELMQSDGVTPYIGPYKYFMPVHPYGSSASTHVFTGVLSNFNVIW